MRLLSVLPLLTLGCAEDLVILTGTIGEGPGVDAPGLAAEIEIIDTQTGEQLLIGSTDSQGAFQFALPLGRNIAALVRSPSTVTASFVGVTGFIDVAIEDGTLYGVPSELVADWRADFEGCPGVADPVMAFGRMEFVNLTGKEGGESPIAGGGRAQLLTDGDPLPACYLDPKTGLYDAKADRTGATGRFAIFGVPTGSTTLDVVFEWAPDVFDSPGPVPVYVPDTGEEIVVPYLPLRLEFPF